MQASSCNAAGCNLPPLYVELENEALILIPSSPSTETCGVVLYDPPALELLKHPFASVLAFPPMSWHKKLPKPPVMLGTSTDG